MTNIKVYYFSPHPIPYNIGIFREASKLVNIDFKVFFEDKIGLESVRIEEFNSDIEWDLDLLSGYESQFLKNYSRNNLGGWFSRINPGIVKVLVTNRPDAVILHGYVRLSDWLVFFTCKALKIRIIFRGEATLKGGENSYHWKQVFKRFLLPKFLKSCDVVLYSCSGNRQYWEFYKSPKDKMLPLLCAVDNDFLRIEGNKYTDNKNLIKKDLEIDNDDMVVLFSGRFSSRKRPLDLIKAISKIDHSKITLLLVGDGYERRKMSQLLKRYSIKHKFAGFVNQSELPKYYSISDLIVVISDHDPSPKVLNEAMNFELPAIVTDVIGTSYDLVRNKENGFIIKVGDTDDLAIKLNYLNKNRQLLTDMGKKSLEIVDGWNFKDNAYWISEAVNGNEKRF